MATDTVTKVAIMGGFGAIAWYVMTRPSVVAPAPLMLQPPVTLTPPVNDHSTSQTWQTGAAVAATAAKIAAMFI